MTETIDYGIAALDVGRVWLNFAFDESAKFRWCDSGQGWTMCHLLASNQKVGKITTSTRIKNKNNWRKKTRLAWLVKLYITCSILNLVSFVSINNYSLMLLLKLISMARKMFVIHVDIQRKFEKDRGFFPILNTFYDISPSKAN